jgi:hypothetical protein
MYDPSAASPSPRLQQQQQQQQMESAPPVWSPRTTYHPGSAVWFAGSFWRCEVGHTSGQLPSGAVSPFLSIPFMTPNPSHRGAYTSVPGQMCTIPHS